MRVATSEDLSLVLELMRGYYRDDSLEFDAVLARATLARLLDEPQWGRVCLIEANGEIVGYLALCIGFSLELGGNDAFIDELFVLPQHRGCGHARRALDFVARSAADWGICALHLEVDRENHRAQRLYSQLGYARRDRYYSMTKLLERPA